MKPKRFFGWPMQQGYPPGATSNLYYTLKLGELEVSVLSSIEGTCWRARCYRKSPELYEQVEAATCSKALRALERRLRALHRSLDELVGGPP